MLAKRQRLPIGEFPHKGFSSLRARYFSIKIANNGKSHNRFAVVIGKNSAKKATRRHYLKRLILGWLEDKTKGSRDFLLIAQGSLEKPTKTMIHEDLEKVLEPLF